MKLNKKKGVFELTEEDLQDPGCMLAAKTFVDNSFAEYEKEAQKIADFYNIDFYFGCCVMYLRGRSRWTEELETQLVQMARDGAEPPNMMEFGHV